MLTAPSRPPAMTFDQLEVWRNLIEQRCGIHFADSRAHHLRGCLWDRMQRLGVEAYRDYFRLVAARTGGREWTALLERLMNHETSFFRNGPSFTCLPALLRSRTEQRRLQSGRMLRLWSAGCATGEEAYSLAMAAMESVAGRDLPALSEENRAPDQETRSDFAAAMSAAAASFAAAIGAFHPSAGPPNPAAEMQKAAEEFAAAARRSERRRQSRPAAPQPDGCSIEVSGSDISVSALERARLGRYPARCTAAPPPGFPEQYMEAAPADGFYDIRPEIRTRVRFFQCNLLDPETYSVVDQDVIFCQNVLIYFQREARERCARHLARCLAPGGFVFFAPGEVSGLRLPGLAAVRHGECVAHQRTEGL